MKTVSMVNEISIFGFWGVLSEITVAAVLGMNIETQCLRLLGYGRTLQSVQYGAEMSNMTYLLISLYCVLLKLKPSTKNFKLNKSEKLKRDMILLYFIF